MVVLDQNPVVEPREVIPAPPSVTGLLFHYPRAGLESISVTPCARPNATQPTQIVEHHPFSAQQIGRGSCDRRQRLARVNRIAIFDADLNRQIIAVRLRYFHNDRQTSRGKFLARDDRSFSQTIWRNQRRSRQVAAIRGLQIFLSGKLYQVATMFRQGGVPFDLCEVGRQRTTARL